jgi:ammonia channel protein AmtB
MVRAKHVLGMLMQNFTTVAVSPLGAAAIGAIASSVCAILVGLKVWFRIDDSSDVVAVHLGGGVIGSLRVGLFATKGINPTGADGLFYGGGYRLLSIQAVTVAAVALYSFVANLLVGGFIGRLVKQRVPARAEAIGIDLALHGSRRTGSRPRTTTVRRSRYRRLARVRRPRRRCPRRQLRHRHHRRTT